jgi:dTDP-4-amino-4,6-dideoxygalactose transaminase
VETVNTHINIVKPFLPSLEEIEQEFAECLRTGLVTNNSPLVRKFEEKLQEFHGSKLKPTVYCNGELALLHLIQAWKIKLGYSPHDTFEVLVPSFTFSGTINAVVMNNLKPVFCDVDESLMLDISRLKVDSPEIRMIVVVGAYGNLADLDALAKFANENKLVVILDNAPAFGSKFKGQYSCHYGFSEMISFHATKIFNSMEGGANIVHDEEIQSYLMRLRDFGQYEKTRGDIDMPGLNSKMQEISALIGLKNLEKVDFILESRFANVERYRQFFGEQEKLGNLKNMVVKDEVICPYLYYPIILNEEATKFVEYMQEHNIAVRRYYTATHELKFYKNRYRSYNLDFTNSIKDRIVSLPLHTIMDEAEFEHLFTTVKNYFN